LVAGFSHSIYQIATQLLLGQIQVHHPKFLITESIYDSFRLTPSQEEQLVKYDFFYSYRLYQYALASFGEVTKGAKIIGLDPDLESKTTDLTKHIDQGRFVNSKDAKELVLGHQLAKFLKARPGQDLVILGTGADGAIASDIFTIVGILKPISDLVDERSIYMGSVSFRDLFSFPEGAHELVLAKRSKDGSYQEPQLTGLSELFPDAEVRTWRELRPQLAQVLDLLSFAGVVTVALVFVALCMLVLNLKLMTTFDRSREYGVMLAIGLHPRQLVYLVLLESLCLALAAGLFACLLGIPAAKWIEADGLSFRFFLDNYSFASLVFEPVLYGYFGPRQLFLPLGFLFLSLPLASLYPAILAARLEPREAIHGKGSGL
jgi:ABC-type lipoprotein release transport system permease subunit